MDIYYLFIWAMGLRGTCGRGLRPLAAAKQLAKDWTCQQIELCCCSFSFGLFWVAAIVIEMSFRVKNSWTCWKKVHVSHSYRSQMSNWPLETEYGHRISNKMKLLLKAILSSICNYKSIKSKIVQYFSQCAKGGWWGMRLLRCQTVDVEHVA